MDGNKKIKILGFFIILIFTVMACQVYQPNYGSFYVDTSKEVEEKSIEMETSSLKQKEMLQDTLQLANTEKQYRDFVKDSLYKVRLHALNESMYRLRIELDSMQYQVEKEFANDNPMAYTVYPVKEMDYRYDTLAPLQDQRQAIKIIPSKEIPKVQEKEVQEEIMMVESMQTANPTSAKRQAETTPEATLTKEKVEVENKTAAKQKAKVQEKEAEKVDKKTESVKKTSAPPAKRQAENSPKAELTNEKVEVEKSAAKDKLAVEEKKVAEVAEKQESVIVANAATAQRQAETTPKATLTNEKVDVDKSTAAKTQPVVQEKKVEEVAKKPETVQVASATPAQRQAETTPKATLTNEKVDVEKSTAAKTQPVVQEKKIEEATQKTQPKQSVAATPVPSQAKTSPNRTRTTSVQKVKNTTPRATTEVKAKKAEETNTKPQPAQGVTVTPSARQSETLTPATMQTNTMAADTMQVDRPLAATNMETKKPMVLTAYYQIGQTQPSKEIMTSLMEALENNKINKVELAGFTDSTGTVAVNKRITNTRINYIYNKIIPLVPLDRIYIQNFGRNFASETRVDEERRVEIRLYVE
ncbi:MAG: hypothetical protein ACK4UK_00975 [Flavobacterium sp.]